MSAGAFGYRDLLEPDDKERLESHVLNSPNDLITRIILKLYQRIESLESEVASHSSVVNMHRPLG
jgi:hypothetical protein